MEILSFSGSKKPTPKSNYKVSFVLVKCSCGNTFEAQLRSIKSGHTKSCGCRKKENNKNLITTKYVKQEFPRLYSIWKNVKTRCTNTKIKQAINYSKRGIKFCIDWTDFIVFKDWALQNGYEDNLSIDRIDVNGNYEPNNCRWADRKTQSENTNLLRSSNSSGYRGVSLKGSKFIARATNNISKERVYLGAFKTAEEAGLAYDNYIIINKLNYPINNLKDK